MIPQNVTYYPFLFAPIVECWDHDQGGAPIWASTVVYPWGYNGQDAPEAKHVEQQPTRTNDPYHHGKRNDPSVHAYRRFLEDVGFTKIGEGCFASVWAFDKADWCLKVSSDRAWLAFMVWAQSHSVARKFVPKLYGVKWHHAEDRYGEAEDYFIATMERIDEVARDSGNGHYRPYDDENAEAQGYEDFAEALSDAGFDSSDLHDNNWGYFRGGHICVFDPTGYQGADSGEEEFANVNGLRRKSKPTYDPQLTFSFMMRP